MSKHLLVCLLLSPFVASVLHAEDLPPVDKWVTYETDNRGLVVKFPSRPKVQQHAVDLPTGKLNLKIAIVETETLALAVNATDFPEGSEVDGDGALKGGVAGMVKNVNGTIVEQKDIKRFGLPGKEVLAKLPTGIFIRAQLILDINGPSLYQLQVLGKSKEIVTGKTGDLFLEQAKIVPKKKADKAEGNTP